MPERIKTNPIIWFEFKDSFKNIKPQIIATNGVIKFTVEVNAAPDNLINLKKINPPIAVLRIPKIMPKKILWFVGELFKGSSKITTKNIKIKKAKYVDPLKTYRGCLLYTSDAADE